MNENVKIERRQREIVRITLIGSVVNALLIVFKFFAGVAASSSAMIADGVHSLSDFLTDFIVIIMLRVSSKPSDESHAFGHGKYETLASTIVGLFLMVVGGGIFWSGCSKIYGYMNGCQLHSPGWLAFAAAVTSIVAKEGIYQYTVRKGRHLRSEALEANAWHHRSDALSSIGTAIGIGACCLLGDAWAILDPVAAVIVSFFIFKVSVLLIRSSVNQLLESSLPKEIEDHIAEMVYSVDGVRDLHHLRTRQVGVRYAINMHVRMNGDLALRVAHDKASEIERRLREEFGSQTMVSVHVEPWKETESGM